MRDGLERAVCKLHELSGLPSSASKTEIKNAVLQYNAGIRKEKEQLTNMVPYRALSEFFGDIISFMKNATGITCIRFGRIRNCIERAIRRMYL